jgi:tetratricopeptide (TPR) repeat protein
MPDLEALRTLQAVVAFRPQSPAAYQAHVAMARHYASLEAPEAADEYRAALALNDTVALRLELARYLEEQGDYEGAYAEYLHILGEQPDAFAGMRRTGQDALTVAKDLNAATYYSDALETLRGNDDPEALPVRARALSGLGRYEEAAAAYQAWLEEMPGDVTAQLGLAQVLMRLGRSEEALSLYRTTDTPDSRLAQAELLEEEDPEEALALYLGRRKGGLRRHCPSMPTWGKLTPISLTTLHTASVSLPGEWGMKKPRLRVRHYWMGSA